MWLTSFEQYRWDVPRRVVVGPVLDQDPMVRDQTAGSPARSGDAAGAGAHARPVVEYVVLTVAATEPDGPMVLLGRRRDGRSWAPPVPGRGVDVAIWQLPDGAPVPTDSAALPRPVGNPTAWCTLVATEAEARAAHEQQASQGHSFASYAERVADQDGSR